MLLSLSIGDQKSVRERRGTGGGSGNGSTVHPGKNIDVIFWKSNWNPKVHIISPPPNFRTYLRRNAHGYTT